MNNLEFKTLIRTFNWTLLTPDLKRPSEDKGRTAYQLVSFRGSANLMSYSLDRLALFY